MPLNESTFEMDSISLHSCVAISASACFSSSVDGGGNRWLTKFNRFSVFVIRLNFFSLSESVNLSHVAILR